MFHDIPLLESGTLGTKANSEVILPNLTDLYNEQEEKAAEDLIPSCTIHNFPYLIEHCMVWARALFSDTFESPCKNVAAFLKDQAEFRRKLKDEGNSLAQRLQLETVKKWLKLADGISFDRCVELAVQEFCTHFRNRINDLTNASPKDAKNDDGSPFWTGHKRFPSAAEFDPENATHLDFVIAASNLYAFAFNVSNTTTDRKKVRDIIASKVKISPWVAVAAAPPPAPAGNEEEKKDVVRLYVCVHV